MKYGMDLGPMSVDECRSAAEQQPYYMSTGCF